MTIAIDMSEYCVYPRTPYPRTPLTATRNRRNFDSSHVAIDRHASNGRSQTTWSLLPPTRPQGSGRSTR